MPFPPAVRIYPLGISRVPAYLGSDFLNFRNNYSQRRLESANKSSLNATIPVYVSSILSNKFLQSGFRSDDIERENPFLDGFCFNALAISDKVEGLIGHTSKHRSSVIRGLISTNPFGCTEFGAGLKTNDLTVVAAPVHKNFGKLLPDELFPQQHHAGRSNRRRTYQWCVEEMLKVCL